MRESELQDHLHGLEEQLLHPDRQADPSALAPLLAEGFREFCSSGTTMDREQTIAVLSTSTPRSAEITHYYVRLLAPGVALATYHVRTAHSATHRSSLWVLRDSQWQLLFHQGTHAS